MSIFYQHILKEAKKQIWRGYRHPQNIPDESVHEYLIKHEKHIILDAIYSFYKEHGEKQLIAAKAEIQHYAKTYKVSLIESTETIFACVTQPAYTYFVKHNPFRKWIWAVFISSIVSFAAGIICAMLLFSH